MNKVILMGRLTRDPEIRYAAGDNTLAIARFTLAVDRRFRRDNNGGDQQTADFINCVVFGKLAEHVEKYYRQGLKVAVTGRIQTGSYTNRDGQKVYTTEVIVEESEFAESKNASAGSGSYAGYGQQSSYQQPYQPSQQQAQPFQPNPAQASAAPAPQAPASGNSALDGFMNIPDGIDEELPFV